MVLHKSDLDGVHLNKYNKTLVGAHSMVYRYANSDPHFYSHPSG